MNEHTHDLWEDFLLLGEKHTDNDVPEFANNLLRFIFKMCFDCAPSKEAVKALTEFAMKEAYEWHLKEKEGEE